MLMMLVVVIDVFLLMLVVGSFASARESFRTLPVSFACPVGGCGVPVLRPARVEPGVFVLVVDSWGLVF